MPPKGYKKGYIKDPETGEWIDPRTIEKKPEVEVVVVKKPKDDLDSTIRPVRDLEYPELIICWKDSKGRSRNTKYSMEHLEIQESISESFSGAKKKTRILLSLEGVVVNKT